MKAALLLVLCLGFAEPAASHIDILAALHKGIPAKKFDILSLLHGGHKKTPAQQDPTGVLSNIMAAAGQSLSLAEKHHEKAVQGARSQLQVLLTKHGGALAQAIQQYNKTLTGAITALNGTKDVSELVLAKAQKASIGDSWESKTGHAQATLGARVSFVEREIRKADRKHKASMRQAMSDADLLLEGSVTKLSRKVGDISDMVKQAQVDLGTAAALVLAPVQTSFAQLKNMELDTATAALVSATQQVDVSDKAGFKTMTAAFDQVEKDLDLGAKSIADHLDASQEEEIKSVRSNAATGAALFKPKPALRKLKKHA